MATQFSSDLKPLTAGTIAATIRALPHLLVIAAFLFVGTAAHAQGPCPPGNFPCILVSDSATAQISVWSDSGAPLNPSLLTGCPSNICPTGTFGGGEGMACICGSTDPNSVACHSTNGSVLYVVDQSQYVHAFNMNLDSNGQADWITSVDTGNSGDVTDLAQNGTGTLLYASEYSPGHIYSLSTVQGPPWLTLTGQTTNDLVAHDIALGNGNCPPSLCPYLGNIVTSYFSKANTGINEYSPNLDLNQTLPSLGQLLPGPLNGSSNCASFNINGTPTQRCWTNLSGMAFDRFGNLWVNSDAANQNGTFEFAPGGTCGAPVCPLNFVPDVTQPGANPLPIGLTIARSDDLDNPGAVLIANFTGSTIDLIDPFSCTGSTLTYPWTLGTCPESQFISIPNGSPKYVMYNTGCPNPDNNGYLEICKQGNTQYPPPNQFYDFTAAAPLFSTGTVQVPLGGCSGSIQVPAGALNLSETPVSGVLVSDVTAYSYNQLGQYVNELINWTQPDLSAVVGVMPGDISLETEAIFTNYSASPGQLKICKVAGQQNIVGQPFMFTVTAPGGYKKIYTIQAGPADQGGYCELADTFPANTPVTVTENLSQGSPYQVSGITVDCNACTYSFPTSSSVATTIGAGITETSFTNIQTGGNSFYNNFGSGTATPYQCSPTGWKVAGATAAPGFITQAAEFTSQNTGSVSEIDLGVNYISGPNQFFVALYSSSGGLPDTELAQWETENAGRCPQPVRITGITGVSLTAGSTYFLVVGPTIENSSIFFLWNLNNQNAMGTHLYATSGCSSGSGNGCNWTSLGTQILAAFQIK